jgi:16S rRNA (cytosine1402-N4)-methyltransferase
VNQHIPVLREQVIEALAIRQSGTYVDATFGRGGHSADILERLGPGGRLLAIDRDVAAVEAGRARFGDDSRFDIVHGEFADIADIARTRGLAGEIDGALFDLGVSSPQLDEADRGFSFLREGPLDMRMNQMQSLTAADYLATVSERDLRHSLRTLGEEPHASRIAAAIVAARDAGKLTSTLELAAVVENAVPARARHGRRHAATRTFQAIRMVVNAELAQLERALATVIDILRVGGRLVVLTFQSLEDRPVKRFMRDAASEDPAYRGLPDMPEAARPRLRLVGKPGQASDAEIDANPRARSARLRVAERLR